MNLDDIAEAHALSEERSWLLQKMGWMNDVIAFEVNARWSADIDRLGRRVLEIADDPVAMSEIRISLERVWREQIAAIEVRLSELGVAIDRPSASCIDSINGSPAIASPG